MTSPMHLPLCSVTARLRRQRRRGTCRSPRHQRQTACLRKRRDRGAWPVLSPPPTMLSCSLAPFSNCAKAQSSWVDGTFLFGCSSDTGVNDSLLDSDSQLPVSGGKATAAGTSDGCGITQTSNFSVVITVFFFHPAELPSVRRFGVRQIARESRVWLRTVARRLNPGLKWRSSATSSWFCSAPRDLPRRRA